MTRRCLHCAIWDTIARHARAHRVRDPETGLPIIERAAEAGDVATVLAQIIASDGDPMRRLEMIESLTEQFLAIASSAACEQPRTDVTMVTRQ